MDIATLQRDLRNYRTVAIGEYDRLSNDDKARQLLAYTIDNRQLRENPVRLDTWFFMPEVWGWEDDIVVEANLEKVDFVVPIKGYSAAIPYNEVNIGRPAAVAQLGQLVPRIPPRFIAKQVSLMLDVFRKNPLTYDGQNFFDTTHAHPLGKGTFSNVIQVDFVDENAPTDVEVRNLLISVRERFTANLAIQSELVFGQEASNLLVVVHKAAHWVAFERVRSAEKITVGTQQVTNTDRGTFELALMNNPTSGEENYIEFQMVETGGAKPAALVIDQDPMLDAWLDNKFRNGRVVVGMKGMFGVKPLFFHTTIQRQPAP